MNKFNYYLDAFKKYSKFEGRANCSQFWYFVLFNFIISFIINFVSLDLYYLYFLIQLLPFWSISVRRLHDSGKSGLFYLGYFLISISFLIFTVITSLSRVNGNYFLFFFFLIIFLIASFYMIYLFIKKGDIGINNFGDKALKTETILKNDSEFGKKVNEITDKIENVANKASEKIEDTVNDIKEKTNTDSEDEEK